MNDKSARTQAYKRGKSAEYLAALFLRLKGYRLLGIRVKKIYEVDLLMRDRAYLVLVEVKYRKSADDGLDAITFQKLARLSAIAPKLMADYKAENVRIDAVIVAKFSLKHIKNISL